MAGQVLWHGRNRCGHDGKIPLRHKYQKLYQDPVSAFCPFQTMARAFSDVFRIHYGSCMKTDENNLVLNQILEPVGLTPAHLDRYPHELSGGEVQRLALARVLLVAPWFIFADEPTSRLDPSVQAHVMRALTCLVEKRGMAVLLVSHDPDLLQAVCHRIYQVSQGRMMIHSKNN